MKWRVTFERGEQVKSITVTGAPDEKAAEQAARNALGAAWADVKSVRVEKDE